MPKIKQVRKRDGRLVPFSPKKIADAIFKANSALGVGDRFTADELSQAVTLLLERNFEDSVPGIEDVQDVVEKVLMETGHASVAKAYILYRDERRRLRDQLSVRKRKTSRRSMTDVTLMVDPSTQDELLPWSKGRIVEALIKETGIGDEVAEEIASAVERKIFASRISRISTSLIRELVDNELFDRGYSETLEKQTLVGMPKYDLKLLINSKSKENSNIPANNPEAINLTIAENTLKQYALQDVFSKDVADAHLVGLIHLHDLGYPTRVYCSSHSLEYLKKYGLQLSNLDTASSPAQHARTLTGHLNTFLASMQAYYAGALGVAYVNILYAPYLEGMTYKQIKQEAQHLIFSGSQSAFSRGGQTLFLDFNIHTGVPGYMKDTPAIGPGGKETGKTYGEYDKVAREFCRALLDVWRAGDGHGHIFAFPKCDLHITEESFEDPDQLDLLKYACLIASENGVPYFVFDRDEVTLSACCRLRTTIKDNYMLKHLESMRFCGFQNITINLPQCAYRAGKGNMEGLYENIDKALDLAVRGHEQKRDFVKTLMSDPSMPLWEIGKTALDGRPYVDLETSTYIVGLIGLNECLQYLIGRELHDDEETLKLGLRIVAHMNLKAKEYGEKTGMKISLEESPAESASRRLAKVDMRRYPESLEVVRGNLENDEYYYTNSIHLRADAPVDLITRIRSQAKFHSLIDSGAIIHGFIGEERPDPDSILNLVRKIYAQTQAAQFTVSPEFTICNICSRPTNGLVATCSHCRSQDVPGITRLSYVVTEGDRGEKAGIAEICERHKI